MAHNDAIFLDLQGVSRQQSVPGRATCPRDRSHQDAPSDVTPEEPHPFHFSFTVMDGDAGGYSVSVSHRGEVHYTAAELKIPDRVAITLGD